MLKKGKVYSKEIYGKYTAYSDGVVVHNRLNRELKAHNGVIKLYDSEGNKVSKRPHRLVLELFPELAPENKDNARFIKMDKSKDKPYDIKNLKWSTSPLDKTIYCMVRYDGKIKLYGSIPALVKDTNISTVSFYKLMKGEVDQVQGWLSPKFIRQQVNELYKK